MACFCVKLLCISSEYDPLKDVSISVCVRVHLSGWGWAAREINDRDFLHHSFASCTGREQDCLGGEKVAVVLSLSGYQVMQQPSGTASTGKLGVYKL